MFAAAPKSRGEKTLDPGLDLSGAVRGVVDGAGQLTVDMRVPAADWESVGGARTPELEQSAAERVSDTDVVRQTNREREVERQRAEDRESDTTCSAPWPRRSPAT